MVLKQSILGSLLKQARFSARTFFWHFEHVYMLSPSSMSFTVTSSNDSCCQEIQFIWELVSHLSSQKPYYLFFQKKMFLVFHIIILLIPSYYKFINGFYIGLTAESIIYILNHA